MATAVTSRDTVAGIGAMALLAAEKPFFSVGGAISGRAGADGKNAKPACC